MSELKTNKISPATGTTTTLGDASDLFQLPASAEIDIASGATLDINGTVDFAGATVNNLPSGGFDSVQVFTSSGTWTRPSGITKVIVHVIGAGGSGGGGRSSYNYTGTGGGAGGSAIKFINVSSISTATVTIGALAAGAAIDASGTDGGDSTWADGTNTVTGNGGDGGLYGGDTYSEPGGTASGGNINSQGGFGSAGPAPNTDGHGGGPGGICCHGFGGSGGGMVRGNYDNDAKGYGHGGAGGAKNCTGGASVPGLIVVWEYK